MLLLSACTSLACSWCCAGNSNRLICCLGLMSMSQPSFATDLHCCGQQACIVLFGRSMCPALAPMQGPCSIKLHDGQQQWKAGTDKAHTQADSSLYVQLHRTCWSIGTVTLVASYVHCVAAVQVCLSHTPSHMSDPRAASSRRHGDAGTAVATRLRLSVCSSSVCLYCNTLSAGQSIARGILILYMCICQSQSSHS